MFTFFCTFRLQVRRPISSRHATCNVVIKKLVKNANIADTDMSRIYTFSLKWCTFIHILIPQIRSFFVGLRYVWFFTYSPILKSQCLVTSSTPSSEKAYQLTTHYILRGGASQKNPPALFVYKKWWCFALPSVAKSQKTDFATDVYVFLYFSTSSEKAYKLTTHYM